MIGFGRGYYTTTVQRSCPRCHGDARHPLLTLPPSAFPDLVCSDCGEVVFTGAQVRYLLEHRPEDVVRVISTDEGLGIL